MGEIRAVAAAETLDPAGTSDEEDWLNSEEDEEEFMAHFDPSWF